MSRGCSGCVQPTKAAPQAQRRKERGRQNSAQDLGLSPWSVAGLGGQRGARTAPGVRPGAGIPRASGKAGAFLQRRAPGLPAARETRTAGAGPAGPPRPLGRRTQHIAHYPSPSHAAAPPAPRAAPVAAPGAPRQPPWDGAGAGGSPACAQVA